jgi:hypothetical protein
MSRTTTARRFALCAATAVSLMLTTAPVAQASAGSPRGDRGLYGTQDPTYDGVFRQSLALIALTTANRAPSDGAIAWLTDQQCADGGWMSYRPDTGKPCAAKKEDTNATAMAVQALVAVGGEQERQAADAGIAWLRTVRNADGGVGYNPGSPSDANSTGLFTNAVIATGGDPGSLRNAAGNTPLDALLDLQVGCDAPRARRGAFAYQPDQSGTLLANDSATAAAVLALSGGHLPVTESTMTTAESPSPCPTAEATSAEPAHAAVGSATSYLGRRLDANDDTIPPLQGKEPDHFTTANAVLSLVAAGRHGTAAAPTRALARNVDDYVPDANGDDQPAALASLVLVAEATGGNPADFGGEDVAARLAASGPPAPPARESGADAANTGGEKEADAGASTLMTIGGILAAGAAVGAAIGLSRRGRRRP